MPKDRRTNSLSSDRARGSPYGCSSKNSDDDMYKSPLPPVGDEKEWEEARCPICMEHPHNAVLLLCSSSGKGCRPFICDTSHRHSNCLDQFRKACGAEITTDTQQPYIHSSTRLHKQHSKLACPLCRRQIGGWVVIEAARKYMNCRARSCSLETCNFYGNYTELRKHARVEHPNVRPAVADVSRLSEWRMFDFDDTFNIFHSFEDDIETSLLEYFLTGVNSESEDDPIYGFNNFLDLKYELDFSYFGNLVASPIYFPMEFTESAINNLFNDQILESPRQNDETPITRRRWDTIPRRARNAPARQRRDTSSTDQFRGSSRNNL